MISKAGKTRVMMVLPKLDRGGAEMLIMYMLAEGFSEDFDISICTLCPSCDSTSELRFRELGIEMHFIDLNRNNFLRIMRRLYILMRRIRPHVVHTHLYPIIHTFLPAALARVPVRVHTVHSVASLDGGVVSRMAARFASRFFGFVLVGISSTIAETVKRYHGVNNVPVVNSGIPVDDFTNGYSTCDRQNMGVNEDDFICIHVASFKEVKNHMMLIEAFNNALKSNKSLVLFLVGQGPLRATVERRVREYGISHKVRFLGLRDDVAGLLCMSDLFVMTSHWEGLPISTMEAMSAGLPVVATDVGGLRDLVDDGKTGFLVKPGDESGFARAIVEMSFDRRRANSMGKAGRERMRRYFSIASTVRGYERLYMALLGERGGTDG